VTTFVRRVPAEFDTTYWRVAPGYMERELGAVPATEAVRHESPKGFASVAGKIEGQRKDQSYCFAPYDGLRGLGMPDVRAMQEYADVYEDSLGAPPVAPVLPSPGGAAPPASSPGSIPDSPALRAIPYVVAAVGLLWLFNKTAKETAPPRPAR
jgi:hypothetical protein